MAKKNKKKVPTLAANDPRVPLLAQQPRRPDELAVEGARHLAAVSPEQGHFMVYDLWQDFLTELLEIPPLAESATPR